MSLFNCDCKDNCNCPAIAIVASVLVGIITAFLQITGVITITTAFLWVVLGVAVVYLAVTVLAAALSENATCGCVCSILNTLLAGILGTVLFSLILLAVGVGATILSAVLSGLLLLFFSLTITSTACYVKCLSDCE